MGEHKAEMVVDGVTDEVLFDGDTGRLSAELRALLTTLLAERVFHGEKKPHLWQVLVENEAAVRSFLHELYLDLAVNPERQVAFKQQVYPEVDMRKFAPRVLLPARTTSVEYAAGVLLLVEESRRAFFMGSSQPRVTRRAFNEAFDLMWGADVTNKVARTRNGNASIRALCEEGLLIGPKEGDEWEVSPAVEVMYGPTELARLADSLSAADLETSNNEDEPQAEPLEDEVVSSPKDDER